MLNSRHVSTDDTTWHKTYEANLRVYATNNRQRVSKSRTCGSPLTFLEDYRGYLQVDVCLGYDPLHLAGKITDVNALLKIPGRPHEALAFCTELFRVERQI